MSTDELTHVQALERLAPDLPPRSGLVTRREFEYIRHGTCSFFINFDVASGQVFAPSSGPTRTEADFVEHVRRTIATDPTAKGRSGVLARGHAGCISERSEPFDRGPLHAQARVLAEPGRDLAEYPGAQAPTARRLPLRGLSAAPGARLHRLLQSHHGQALQVDLSRQATPCLIH